MDIYAIWYSYTYMYMTDCHADLDKYTGIMKKYISQLF